MKLNARIFALVFGLFSIVPVLAVDTLQVFAIRVQFKEEKPDNSLTTGIGLFDSDKENKDDYKLDPLGRSNPAYWKKHFDFANAYFNKASNGHVVIDAHIYPEGSNAYSLKKQIIDYNRTSKKDGEKTAEFDDARSRDYLQFVYDAVMAAHESGDSPFNVPLSKNPNTKRAYMIIHAGASRLVDGGSMGTRGADTPGDFMDVYIDKSAWLYLPDSIKNAVYRKEGKKANGKDSLVAEALLLKDAVVDTLKSIMVTSETASQDGLNWGVNGIIVNQIARELGLPNTYDVVKGISRLGYYDVMDFAGYNAGNGFLPSMPAAWERAYMGWTQVKEVRPVAGKPVTVEIAAAGTGLGTEIVKVPLSASEYLLIENRQRSWNKNGEVSVTADAQTAEGVDTTIWTVPVDSLNLLFEDEDCTNGKCKKKGKKANGIIVDVSSFDAGLPASGIVVWRVNDWYLRETLEYGIANFWGGDTLRDHQFGIAMVEADGILSIGKTFKNALGEDTYDYGSGTDLLPHLRKPSKDSKQEFDIVKTIDPVGYANTMTTQGGYTGIKIEVDVPKKAREEKTSNAFMGDSVINYGALKMSVTISIDDGSIKGSVFPRNIGLASAVRGAVFVDDPENEGEKLLVVGAMDGTLQVFNALGDTLFPADTVIKQKTLSRDGSKREVPLYRVNASDGPLVGMASDGKDVYSLHTNQLVKTSFVGGVPMQEPVRVDSAVAGPILHDGYVYFADRKGSVKVNTAKMQKERPDSEFNIALNNVVDMAYCGHDANGRDLFAYVTDDGRFVLPSYGMNEKMNGKTGETWRVACTDLGRDGKMVATVVGSRGTVAAVSLNAKKLLWSKTYKRGAAGSSGLKDETSGIAIGDINGDSYPEIVFLGDNLVYALDRSGLPVAGFPAKISRGSPVFGFFSDPVIVDVSGDDVPEILVPSSEGLVYAVNGKGKLLTDGFPMAAGSFEYIDSTSVIQPMSIFVTNAISDKKSKGPELYALHRNNVSAFRLRKASADAAESAAAWTLPAGGNERTGFFDASKLKKVEKVVAKDEISEFFMFPNPVRGGNAKARFEIGAPAKNATLELYDITGLCVFKAKMSDLEQGRNQFEKLDLKHVGSDVYTARLKVKFESGKTKQKLYRVGVVK